LNSRRSVESAGNTVWSPDVLNYAVGELRREFPQQPLDRIVNSINFAARTVRSDQGQVRLLQRAREGLRS
jgi:hypothetical protein